MKNISAPIVLRRLNTIGYKEAPNEPARRFAQWSFLYLISGAGATLEEYYGLNHYVGALLMAAMALTAYLIGFHRFVRIVSFIGPAIIVFSIFVGIVTVCRDFDGLAQVGSAMVGGDASAMKARQPVPWWWLS